MTQHIRKAREVKLLGYNSHALKAEHFAVSKPRWQNPAPGKYWCATAGFVSPSPRA